jgi:nitrogen regulatory protein P-II 2
MHTVPLKLVTIIAEGLLRDRLVHELLELGATGYTLSEVKGEGSRGVRASDFAGRNVRIESIVPPGLADRILDHLAEHYFAHYAVVVYTMDVDVVRGDKYVGD